MLGHLLGMVQQLQVSTIESSTSLSKIKTMPVRFNACQDKIVESIGTCRHFLKFQAFFFNFGKFSQAFSFSVWSGTHRWHFFFLESHY